MDRTRVSLRSGVGPTPRLPAAPRALPCLRAHAPGPAVKPPQTGLRLHPLLHLRQTYLFGITCKGFFCRGNQTPQSGCLEWWPPASLPPEPGVRAPASDRTSFREQAASVAAETHTGAPLALCSESPPLGCLTCLVLFPAVQVLPLCSDRKITPHFPAVSISRSYFGTLARSGFIFPTLHFCLWLPLCWVFSGLLFLIPSSSVPSAFLSKSVVFHVLFLSLRSVIVSN